MCSLHHFIYSEKLNPPVKIGVDLNFCNNGQLHGKKYSEREQDIKFKLKAKQHKSLWI